MATITGDTYNQIQQNIGPHGDTRLFVLSHTMSGNVNGDLIKLGKVSGDLHIVSAKWATDGLGASVTADFGWRLVDGSQSDPDAFSAGGPEDVAAAAGPTEALDLPVKTTALGTSSGDLRGGFEFTATIGGANPTNGKILYLVVEAKVL